MGRRIGLLLLCIMYLFAFISCEPNSIVDTDAENDADVVAVQPTSVGEGTAESPYTVCQVLAGTQNTTDVYVCGYIVGFFKNNTVNQSVFDSSGAVVTNILLAPSPDVTDTKHVLTVQLSSDKIRREVSLAYHPEGLHQAVMLQTEVIASYANAEKGLRKISQAIWIDNPSSLDFLYGHDLHSTQTDDPENPENPDDSDDSDNSDNPISPDDSDQPSTVDDADDTFDVNGATGFLPVEGVNQNSGRDENYPCLIDYVIGNEPLRAAYTDAGGWLMGYVASWYSDTMFVLSITPTLPTVNMVKGVMYVELEKNPEMLEWMKRKYDIYGNKRMLRVKCGAIKLKTTAQQGYYINAVETLIWTDWQQ